MTMAAWFSAAAVDGRDGAAAKITQLQDLGQDARALLFQGGEGMRQRAPPFRTYTYVRIIATKKGTCHISLCESRTHSQGGVRFRHRPVVSWRVQATLHS